MCKSEVNACFTRSLDPSSPRSLLSHGCSNPLPNSDDACRSDAASDTSGRGSSTLECCHEDMCNYRGLQDLAYGRRETLGMDTCCSEFACVVTFILHVRPFFTFVKKQWKEKNMEVLTWVEMSNRMNRTIDNLIDTCFFPSFTSVEFWQVSC